MQDPEQIKRFTRGAAVMKDPPWLPIALWMAVVLLGGPTLHDPNTLASIIMTAFGLGWAFVCIQDYRVFRRNLGNAQH